MRSRSSSIAVDPHMPHAVLVAESRGVGSRRGAAGVDAHDVELAVDRAARCRSSGRSRTGAPASSPSPWTQPDGQLEVVARRAHRGAHQVAVEVDLERLLHDQAVGPPPERVAVPVLGEHRRRAAAGHGPRVPTRLSRSVSGGGGSAGASARSVVEAVHPRVHEHADHRRRAATRKLVWVAMRSSTQHADEQQRRARRDAVAARPRRLSRAQVEEAEAPLLRLHERGPHLALPQRPLVGALLLELGGQRPSSSGDAAPASTRRSQLLLLGGQLRRQRRDPIRRMTAAVLCPLHPVGSSLLHGVEAIRAGPRAGDRARAPNARRDGSPVAVAAARRGRAPRRPRPGAGRPGRRRGARARARRHRLRPRRRPVAVGRRVPRPHRPVDQPDPRHLLPGRAAGRGHRHDARGRAQARRQHAPPSPSRRAARCAARRPAPQAQRLPGARRSGRPRAHHLRRRVPRHPARDRPVGRAAATPYREEPCTLVVVCPPTTTPTADHHHDPAAHHRRPGRAAAVAAAAAGRRRRRRAPSTTAPPPPRATTASAVEPGVRGAGRRRRHPGRRPRPRVPRRDRGQRRRRAPPHQPRRRGGLPPRHGRGAQHLAGRRRAGADRRRPHLRPPRHAGRAARSATTPAARCTSARPRSRPGQNAAVAATDQAGAHLRRQARRRRVLRRRRRRVRQHLRGLRHARRHLPVPAQRHATTPTTRCRGSCWSASTSSVAASATPAPSPAPGCRRRARRHGRSWSRSRAPPATATSTGAASPARSGLRSTRFTAKLGTADGTPLPPPPAEEGDPGPARRDRRAGPPAARARARRPGSTGTPPRRRRSRSVRPARRARPAAAPADPRRDPARRARGRRPRPGRHGRAPRPACDPRPDGGR